MLAPFGPGRTAPRYHSLMPSLSLIPSLSPPDFETKAQARAYAYALRERALEQPAALQADSERVVAALREFLRAQGAGRVLAYYALPGEPDVSGLQAHFELFTTRTRFRPERRLTLHPYASATERSKAGYLQPPADAPQVALPSIDAVLLPALAYDLSGVRLGYGGGFYDRLLPAYSGLKVGVTFAPFLLANLPAEPHDIRADWLATQEGVRAAAGKL